MFIQQTISYFDDIEKKKLLVFTDFNKSYSYTKKKKKKLKNVFIHQFQFL